MNTHISMKELLRRYYHNRIATLTKTFVTSGRLGLRRMESIRSVSTLWRATCRFPLHQVDYRDYMRGTLEELDIITYHGEGICKKVLCIDIRGNKGENITIPFWQSEKYQLHTDSSYTTCEFEAAASTAVSSEDNFGFYSIINDQFRCTKTTKTTTQYWLGAYV